MDVVKYGDYFARQGWYPANRDACLRVMEEYTKEEPEVPKERSAQLQGGVVPHAGWAFSGDLAAKVFQTLGQDEDIDLLVLFGGHMGPASRAWILGDGVWKTPVGDLRGDPEFATELASRAGALDPAVLGPGEYQPDNTVELQLPFARHFLKDVSLVVAGVPASKQGLALGAAAATLARERDIRAVAVGSTDLTHYGINYDFMPMGMGAEAVRWVKDVNDKRAIENIERLDVETFLEDAIKRRNACCPGAAGAALTYGREQGGREAKVIGYRTSYDVHPGNSFVGYVAAVF